MSTSSVLLMCSFLIVHSLVSHMENLSILVSATSSCLLVSGPKSELCIFVAPPGDFSLMVPVCSLVI